MSKQISAFAVYSKEAKTKPEVPRKKSKKAYLKKLSKKRVVPVEGSRKLPKRKMLGDSPKNKKLKKSVREKKRKLGKKSLSGDGLSASKKHKSSPWTSNEMLNGFTVSDMSDDSDAPQLIELKVPGQIDDVEVNPFAFSQNLINFLLTPIRCDDFFENYWEKQPLHVRRQAPLYYKNLLTSEKLDKILRNNPLYYTRNVDVVTYENGQRLTHNPEGRAKPVSVWDYYSNGCSVRILNPQTYSHKVRKLLETLQEYFGTMVGVNVYLTPSGTQGFAPHYDDIEAFVLQLEGRKHWKIYSPRSKEQLPRYSSPNLNRDLLGQPLMEITVEAGDLLYFPRGFIHEAHTDNDSHSLHITVSVYQNTAYVDLLERLLPEALRVASKHDVEFRQGLPLHYLEDLGAVNANKSSQIRDTVFSNVQKLIYKLWDYAPIDWATDQMGRKFMREALPPELSKCEDYHTSKNDGEYLQNGVVQDRAEFAPDTMVRLVRYHSLRLCIENETTAKIYYCTENANVYHGEEEQSLDIDVGLVGVLQTLLLKYPSFVSIEDIPSQDDGDKINIISDLWEKGLVVTKESLDVSSD